MSSTITCSGEEPAPFDLLHWNSDTTNLPAGWHRNYLETLYKGNKLAENGGISVAGTPIDLGQVKTPTYIQAGREDHIAPPQSVWKIMDHFQGDKRFVLAGSGHIAGVVNPPAARQIPILDQRQAVRHARSVHRRRDRAQGQLVARLDRLAEEAGRRRRSRPRARAFPARASSRRSRTRPAAMSKRAEALSIRPARPDERDGLEELQRRASLALAEYRDAAARHIPTRSTCPPSRSSTARCIVAEVDGRIAGFAASSVGGRARRPVRRARAVAAGDRRGAGRGRGPRSAAARPGADGRSPIPARADFYESCGFTVEGEAQTRFGPALRMSR